MQVVQINPDNTYKVFNTGHKTESWLWENFYDPYIRKLDFGNDLYMCEENLLNEAPKSEYNHIATYLSSSKFETRQKVIIFKYVRYKFIPSSYEGGGGIEWRRYSTLSKEDINLIKEKIAKIQSKDFIKIEKIKFADNI